MTIDQNSRFGSTRQAYGPVFECGLKDAVQFLGRCLIRRFYLKTADAQGRPAQNQRFHSHITEILDVTTRGQEFVDMLNQLMDSAFKGNVPNKSFFCKFCSPG